MNYAQLEVSYIELASTHISIPMLQMVAYCRSTIFIQNIILSLLQNCNGEGEIMYSCMVKPFLSFAQW